MDIVPDFSIFGNYTETFQKTSAECMCQKRTVDVSFLIFKTWSHILWSDIHVYTSLLSCFLHFLHCIPSVGQPSDDWLSPSLLVYRLISASAASLLLLFLYLLDSLYVSVALHSIFGALSFSLLISPL